MSNHQASLFDQLWVAIWGWLERHDSLTGALISVGLGGALSWLAWRARQARLRQERREESEMEWRESVERRMDGIMPRADIVRLLDKLVNERQAQIADIHRRMDGMERRIEKQLEQQARDRAEHLRLVRGDIGKLSDRVELLIARAINHKDGPQG